MPPGISNSFAPICANRELRAAWPELTRHLPASLLTSRELEAIFSVSDGWKRFYTKYPGSPGIIHCWKSQPKSTHETIVPDV